MEANNNSQDYHIVEIKRNNPAKFCGEVRCEFENAKTNTADAAERSASMRKLVIAVVLCVIFMIAEVIGGIKANSLAILTDAAHMFSDVAGFAISLFSLWAAGWESTPRRSYGCLRVEILGALMSIQLIWLLAVFLVYEAVGRIKNQTGQVNGFLMFVVATFGLVVNIIMALVLGHRHSHGHENDGHGHETKQEGGLNKKKRNINVEGAYLHVIGDSIQSIGVMIGGGLIWYNPKWKIVDLICTIIFSILVVGTTIKMFRNNIFEVLMESTPREIDAAKLQRGLLEMEEVVAVHELHIWAITVGKILLACHVKVIPEADANLVLDKIIDYIRREYNISHVTIQIEV